MSDNLQVYLEDHLAGAAFAIDVFGALREQHAGEPLATFAAEMLVEIEADESVLKAFAERIGISPSGSKGFSAWLSEKASRIKLHRDAGEGLGTFEALEFLSLGILGKRAMWRALAAAAPLDSRLSGMDFDGLCKRAELQHAQVESRRIEYAQTALQPK